MVSERGGEAVAASWLVKKRPFGNLDFAYSADGWNLLANY
jgi:hypothetical protein